ncbi:MAG: PIN domain-containing protein [Candidatus Woesearchaeota archaeon]
MKVVIDSNILFTYFWMKSSLRELVLRKRIVFFTPDLFLRELEKYSIYIKKKNNYSNKDFDLTKQELFEMLYILPVESYENSVNIATKCLKDIDTRDIDFTALAHKVTSSPH